MKKNHKTILLVILLVVIILVMLFLLNYFGVIEYTAVEQPLTPVKPGSSGGGG